MVNKSTLIGYLGRDPEFRRLENGKIVCKFAVACSYWYKDSDGDQQQVTDWVEVRAWGSRLAEYGERNFKKGSLVYVEGMIKTDSYRNKNGDTVYTTYVHANELKLLK